MSALSNPQSAIISAHDYTVQSYPRTDFSLQTPTKRFHPCCISSFHVVFSSGRIQNKCFPIEFYEENSKCRNVSAPTASSFSELSSLHDGGNTDFRHTYQTVQMKALPPIADLDDQSVLRASHRTQSRRPRRIRGNYSDDELDRRYKRGVI